MKKILILLIASALPAFGLSQRIENGILVNNLNGNLQSITGLAGLSFNDTAAKRTITVGTANGVSFGESATAKIGFYGGTAVVRGSGSVITLLQNLNLGISLSIGSTELTMSATQRVIGRNSASGGPAEEITATQILDWIGNTRGSVLYRGASVWSILAPGTSNYPLISNGAGADPTYQQLSLSGAGITGTLGVLNGGSGLNTAALGDLRYGSGTNTIAALAGSTSSTMAVLTQTGNGTTSAAPVWTTTTGSGGSVVRATAPIVTGGSFTALTSLAIRSTGSGAFDLTFANTENLTAGRTLTITMHDAARTIDLSGNLTLAGAVSLPVIAQGDIWYGSAAGTISALAKNATATRYLSNTGTSNNPAWAQIDLTNGVTGNLPLGNGGSNANLTASNGGIVYSTASAFAILSGTSTAGQILRSGATAAPTWSTATFPATAGAANNGLVSDGANWASSAIANSVFGRTGAVVAASGDYTAAQVTNAADLTAANIFTAANTDKINDSATNALTTIFTYGHNSTGTAAANFGGSLLFNLESSTTSDRNAAQFDWYWTTATDASRTSAVAIELVNNAGSLAKVMYIFGSGGASLNTSTDPGAGIFNVNTGYEIAGVAPSGQFVRGDGTKGIFAAIGLTDLPTTATKTLYGNSTTGTSTPSGIPLDGGFSFSGTGAGATLRGYNVSQNVSASNIDASTGKVHRKTITANTTFTWTNFNDGDTIFVEVTENGTGGFTVTWPTVRWTGGVAPTQTSGANKIDTYTFVNVNGSIDGSYIQDVR